MYPFLSPEWTATPMSNNLAFISQAGVKKTYRFYAPFYDYVFGAILEPGRLALSQEVALLRPGHLLEVGVGTGLLLGQYPVATQITGIDISDEMLHIAKSKAQDLQHMAIHLETMDAEKLTFVDHSFDCVVVPYVLSVTPNPDALVNELKRVCKKDGHIIILNHFSGSGAWVVLEKMVKRFAEKIGFRSEFSYDANISRHQFHVVKLKNVNLFGLSKLLVIKNI
jgi:phosphatidylethanolamine/phosphatidyl-N-methylethanolamine N-methyltransferase